MYYKHNLEQYRIFFSFRSRKERISEVFEYLRKQKSVYWAARTGGSYDLAVVIFAKDFRNYDQFIADFNTQFPGLVKGFKSSYAVDHHIFRHKFLSKDRYSFKYGELTSDKNVQIDDLDYHILSQIKDNCRKSSLDIAKGTDVSYKTILNRIKTLEKKNIILGYRIYLKKIEKKPSMVLLSFKDYSIENEKKVLSYLSEERDVTQLVRLFGRWNLLVHVRKKGLEELQDFVVDIRDNFDIIDDCEIVPVFEDISINLLPC